jgi:hypothetical protein
MQMQFNVVSTQTLRDAVEHPENHRNLMVRISGYNAFRGAEPGPDGTHRAGKYRWPHGRAAQSSEGARSKPRP